MVESGQTVAYDSALEEEALFLCTNKRTYTFATCQRPKPECHMLENASFNVYSVVLCCLEHRVHWNFDSILYMVENWWY